MGSGAESPIVWRPSNPATQGDPTRGNRALAAVGRASKYLRWIRIRNGAHDTERKLLSKLYDDVVMDHIKNARNYRPLGDAELSATGLNALCGDGMTVYVKLGGEAIAAAAFQCECCGISMASASVMTEAVSGRALSEVKVLHEAVVVALDAGADTLGGWEAGRAIVEAVRAYPSRRRCALLPWATLAAALAGEAEAKV